MRELALTDKARERLTVCLAVAAIASVKAAMQLRDIDLLIASLSTSSPLGFIWLHLYPEMSAYDWVTGSSVFRFSLPMQILLWIVKITGVNPEALIWPFGFVQIVFLLCAVAYLAQVLFERAAVTIAITAVVAVCPVAGLNFANFGAGIGNMMPVVYYSSGNAFKFIALALFLRGRWVHAAVALALASYCHLTLGLYMACFMAAMALADLSSLKRREPWLAVLVYVLLMAPLAAAYLAGSTPTTGTIKTEEWVLMSQLFNYHWHPIQLGMFGAAAWLGAFPFLALLLAYLVARTRVSAMGADTDRKLVLGMVACAVLTVLGVLLSDVWHVPLIMKLAPQRASELISLVLLLYYVRYLVLLIEEGNVVDALLAGWSLALLLTGSTGLALLPLFVIALREGIRVQDRKMVGIAALALAVLSALAVLETIAAGFGPTFVVRHKDTLEQLISSLWTPLQSLTPLGSQDFLLLGGSFGSRVLLWLTAAAMLLAALPAMSRRSAAMPKRIFLAGLTTVLILLIASVQHVRWEAWAHAYREQAAAFKDVQLWAAKATPLYSVFMGDPGFANGWREYSRRPYFGSLSELAHFATLYDSPADRFEPGLARVREFGLDVRSVKRTEPVPAGGIYGVSILGPRISEAFNRMSADQYVAISQRYGVDYVIVERSKRKAALAGLPLAYRNALYDVYRLPGRQPRRPD
jgi:hypothetical protein